MSDGATVISELDRLVERLDTASRTLYSRQSEIEEIQEQVDDLRNDLLVSMLEQYEQEGKRLPGEDVRNALITKRIREQQPEMYGRWRRLRAEIDRGEARAKQLQHEISAKQSILSYLRTEAQATQ